MIRTLERSILVPSSWTVTESLQVNSVGNWGHSSSSPLPTPWWSASNQTTSSRRKDSKPHTENSSCQLPSLQEHPQPLVNFLFTSASCRGLLCWSVSLLLCLLPFRVFSSYLTNDFYLFPVVSLALDCSHLCSLALLSSPLLLSGTCYCLICFMHSNLSFSRPMSQSFGSGYHSHNKPHTYGEKTIIIQGFASANSKNAYCYAVNRANFKV